MAALLVLARFRIHPLDEATARSHYEGLTPLLEAVDGFEGHLLAVDHHDPAELLAISRYRDLASAERGLVVVAQKPLREKIAVSEGVVFDVGRYTVESESRRTGMGAPVGRYVSVTVRNAEPGRARELADDLDRIFGELSVIPGMSGHTVAFHESLPEQALGLAAWTTPQSFERSLPDGRIHDVKLYKRLV